MIIHDLKNPLAAIQGYGQLLQRRAARGEPIPAQSLADTAARVESSARLLVAMLDDLLEAARVRANDAPPLDRRSIDLVALVRRIAQAHPRNTDAHRILFQSNRGELVGEWDRSRLERALDNLIGNAFKYSPDGGGVSVDVIGDGDMAIVRIVDQGIGIPAADLPHVFERFHRGANAIGQIDGWGIGLASVQQIITQHGGTVEVASRERHGSTFTVRLPLFAESDAHLSERGS